MLFQYAVDYWDNLFTPLGYPCVLTGAIKG
jgi:hypothetical protein